MFIGPWDQGGEWDDSGLAGVSRWLNRVWNLMLTPPQTTQQAPAEQVRELRRMTHKTIRRVTEDIERFRFNTMVAALMEYTNYLTRLKESGPVDAAGWQEAMTSLTLLLAPSAPHLAEELWERSGKTYSVHNQAWPDWDAELAAEERDHARRPGERQGARPHPGAGGRQRGAGERDRANERQGAPYVEGRETVRVVYVPGRLVNVVVR